MKIAICSDHRGYKLKKQLINFLIENDIQCDDFGSYNEERTDYPIFAFKVGEAVVNKEVNYGVVICASGAGMSISVNKVKGVRCVVGTSKEQVELAKNHNDINVLSIAADETKLDMAFVMIKALLSTPFLYDRYQNRIDMINEYEKKNK